MNTVTSSPAAHLDVSPLAYPVASVSRFIEDERGQDMIEYALIAATVGLGTVAGVNGLAASVSHYMSIVGAGFEHALGHG
ncbi:MAG TPA: hypothetical protein VHU44_10665 [Acidobacteriaceae bacterium]|nr:hypothetical protein [Acidobacteriaceae bacterium]